MGWRRGIGNFVLEGLEDAGFGGVGGLFGEAGGEVVDALDDFFERAGFGGFSDVVGAGVEFGEEGGEVRGEGFVANRAAECEGVAEAGFGESAGGAGDGQGVHRRARGVVSGFLRSWVNQAVAA